MVYGDILPYFAGEDCCGIPPRPREILQQSYLCSCFYVMNKPWISWAACAKTPGINGNNSMRYWPQYLIQLASHEFADISGIMMSFQWHYIDIAKILPDIISIFHGWVEHRLILDIYVYSGISIQNTLRMSTSTMFHLGMWYGKHLD